MDSEPKLAVVAIIQRKQKMLAIKRSASVRAPNKWCFPGGSVEVGESILDALQRELHEELNLTVKPIKEVFCSVTPWEVQVHWWTAKCESLESLVINDKEVADVAWLDAIEFRQHPDLLESNQRFLDLLIAGEISLEGV